MNNIISIGLDFSLTHYGLAGLCSSKTEYANFHAVDNRDTTIKYKQMDFPVLWQKLDNVLLNIQSISEQWMLDRPIPVGIDFSDKVHYKSNRQQTIYESLAHGYLMKYFRANSLIYDAKIIRPSEVRHFADLPKKTKKDEMQKWYLTNTLVGDIVGIESANEDTVDALILAYIALEWKNANR